MPTSGVPKGKQRPAKSIPFNRRDPKYARPAASVPFNRRETAQTQNMTPAAQENPQPPTPQPAAQNQSVYTPPVWGRDKIITQQQQPATTLGRAAVLGGMVGQVKSAPASDDKLKVSVSPVTIVSNPNSTTTRTTTKTTKTTTTGEAPVTKTTTTEGFIETGYYETEDIKRSYANMTRDLSEGVQHVNAAANYFDYQKRAYASAILGEDVTTAEDKTRAAEIAAAKTTAKKFTGFMPFGKLTNTALAFMDYVPKPETTIKQQEEDLTIARNSLEEVEKQALKRLGQEDGSTFLSGYMLVKNDKTGEETVIAKTFTSPSEAWEHTREVRTAVVEPALSQLADTKAKVYAWLKEDTTFTIPKPTEYTTYTGEEARQRAKIGDDAVQYARQGTYRRLDTPEYKLIGGEGVYIHFKTITDTGEFKIEEKNPFYGAYEGFAEEDGKITLTKGDYAVLSDKIRHAGLENVYAAEEEVRRMKEQQYIENAAISGIVGLFTGGFGAAALFIAASVPSTAVEQYVTQETENPLYGLAAGTVTFLGTTWAAGKLINALTQKSVDVTALKSIKGVENEKMLAGGARSSGYADVKGTFGKIHTQFKGKNLFTVTDKPARSISLTKYGSITPTKAGASLSLKPYSVNMLRQEVSAAGYVTVPKQGFSGWLSRTGLGKKLGMSTTKEYPYFLRNPVEKTITETGQYTTTGEKVITAAKGGGDLTLIEETSRKPAYFITSETIGGGGKLTTPRLFGNVEEVRGFSSYSETFLTKGIGKADVIKDVKAPAGIPKLNVYVGSSRSLTELAGNTIVNERGGVLYKILNIPKTTAAKVFGSKSLFKIPVSGGAASVPSGAGGMLDIPAGDILTKRILSTSAATKAAPTVINTGIGGGGGATAQLLIADTAQAAPKLMASPATQAAVKETFSTGISASLNTAYADIIGGRMATGATAASALKYTTPETLVIERQDFRMPTITAEKPIFAQPDLERFTLPSSRLDLNTEKKLGLDTPTAFNPQGTARIPALMNLDIQALSRMTTPAQIPVQRLDVMPIKLPALDSNPVSKFPDLPSGFFDIPNVPPIPPPFLFGFGGDYNKPKKGGWRWKLYGLKHNPFIEWWA